jgi:DNA-directed RNA polymerase subunit delta
MNSDWISGVHANLNVEDIIYRTMKSTREAMHYKELIQKALEIKEHILMNSESHREAASILTDINLDGRFIHYGNGLWGLRAWRQRGEPKANLVKALKNRRTKKALLKAQIDDDDLEEEMEEEYFEWEHEEEEPYEAYR